MDALGPIRAQRQPDPAGVPRLVQEHAQARGANGLPRRFDVVVRLCPSEKGKFSVLTDDDYHAKCHFADRGQAQHANERSSRARQQEAHPVLDEEPASRGHGE